MSRTQRLLAAEKNPLSEKNRNCSWAASGNIYITNLMNSCLPTISGDGYADAAENISDCYINTIRTMYQYQIEWSGYYVGAQ